MSSNLSETAGREAIEAERQVAERKRQGSEASKTEELLASMDRFESPGRQRPSSPSTPRQAAQAVEAEGAATSFVAKTGRGHAQLDDNDLETADWAGDYLDRRVKTVSNEQEDVVDTSEPLLDSREREPDATDLFDDEEATVRVQSPAPRSGQTATANPAKKPALPGKASLEGTSEHPWAKNAPAAAPATVAKRPAARVSLDDRELTGTAAHPPTRAAASTASKAHAAKPPQQDDARQAEAKARVQTLLTQARSLLSKGELRSAFRVAQLAQRIADSEDLFFVPGEEQPADIVRSVLMKIRSNDIQLASSARTTFDESAIVATPVSRTTGTQIRPRPNRSNLPDGWSSTDGEEGEDRSTDKLATTDAVDNPWGDVATVSPAKPRMRIEPGPSSRGSRANPQFPNSRPEWRNAANEPLDLSCSAEEAPAGISTAKDGRRASQVNQADMHSSPSAGLRTETTPDTGALDLVPRSLASKPRTPGTNPLFEERGPTNSEPLALAGNWRNQDLNDTATNRGPLLVAPLPPDERLIPVTLGVDVDDTFATEIQEPSPPQPESRLWMMLAAAAGAFAMLFVRRRPAAVTRPVADGK